MQILSEQVMNTHLNDEVGGTHQMAPLVENDFIIIIILGGCLAMAAARYLQFRCLPQKWWWSATRQE